MDGNGSIKGRVISVCKNCNGEYSQPFCRVKRDKFCTRNCIDSYREKQKNLRKVNCRLCDKEFIARNSQLKEGKKPFCSISCASKAQVRTSERYDKAKATRLERGGYVTPSGKDNKLWVGRFEEKNGYVKIWVGPRKYRAEHRINMEDHLNRKLTSQEIVHHKNGNKKDNRICNLELHSRSSHAKLHAKLRN